MSSLGFPIALHISRTECCISLQHKLQTSTDKAPRKIVPQGKRPGEGPTSLKFFWQFPPYYRQIPKEKNYTSPTHHLPCGFHGARKEMIYSIPISARRSKWQYPNSPLSCFDRAKQGANTLIPRYFNGINSSNHKKQTFHLFGTSLIFSINVL